MLKQEEIMLIKIMHQQGYSKKAIARKLGLSVNTIRKHIRADGQIKYSRRPPKATKLSPYYQYIKQRVQNTQLNPIPATVIFQEVNAMGYTGSLTTVRNYVRQFKPVNEEPVIRFETQPGQQMQVDWAQFRKRQNRLSAFIATLGYSRASYVEFVCDEKLDTLLRCHENAFDYFGGIPYQILYDNMKTVIIERNRYGQGKHRLQSAFWDFAKHYGFIPKLCRPYRAQTKGKVERFIRYLRYSFYNPLVSQLSPSLLLDHDTANQNVRRWLNTVANCRVHATTQQRPFERLEIERKSLQDIPRRYIGVLPNHALEATPQQPLPRHKQDVTVLQHELSVYESLSQGGI